LRAVLLLHAFFGFGVRADASPTDSRYAHVFRYAPQCCESVARRPKAARSVFSLRTQSSSDKSQHAVQLHAAEHPRPGSTRSSASMYADAVTTDQIAHLIDHCSGHDCDRLRSVNAVVTADRRIVHQARDVCSSAVRPFGARKRSSSSSARVAPPIGTLLACQRPPLARRAVPCLVECRILEEERSEPLECGRTSTTRNARPPCGEHLTELSRAASHG